MPAFLLLSSCPMLLLQLVLDVRRIMQQLQQPAASQDDSSSSSGVDVVDMASRLSALGYRVTVGGDQHALDAHTLCGHK